MLVSSRTTNILLVLVLAVGVGIVAMLATDARGGPLDPGGTPASTDSVRLPGTPISGQTTISAPGHYYVTRNFTVNGSVAAIAINASDVSLDLGGFTLRGDEAVNSLGVWITGARTNVSISNGAVRDFNYGVHTEGGTQVRIENVSAISNGRGFHIGDYQVLTNCTAMQNTEHGIYVPGDRVVVRECQAIANGGDGITTDSGALLLIERSFATDNANDIRDVTAYFAFNTIRENVAGTISGGDHVVDNVCLNGFGVAPSLPPATDHANAYCTD